MDTPRSSPPAEAARELAEEVLGRLSDGEPVDLQALAARLPDEAARRAFLDLVEQGRRVQGLLPRVLRAGDTLGGRYRLQREVGAGGMGRVFEALDMQLERPVAVKVLTALGGDSFDQAQQFLNEAVLLAALRHPNIVAVHELGRAPGDQPFLVMELVEGTAASEVLDRVRAALAARGGGPPRDARLLHEAIGRPLPAGRKPPPAGDDWFRAVARVVLDVARTLEAAHSRGIVHRDVKPHNVLLRGDATPVVLDFGLAGSLDRARGALSRGLYGTVAYLAPEQVEAGRIGTDPRTDVYQAGLLLYELLTLRRAFPGDEISALLARIGRGEFLRPRAVDRGVPPELEAVCLKAMELDPARRYATMRELREDLQRWTEDSQVPHAARGGPLAAGLRQARYALRRRKLEASVLATAAAALLSAVLLWPEQAPWSGQFRTFRQTAAGEYDPGPVAEVQPGDQIGLAYPREPDAEPVHLYVLSVFAAPGEPRRVAPMVVDVLELPRHDGESTAWGRELQPGQHAICTQVDEAARDGQFEGLLVYAAADADPALEEWMRGLSYLASLDPSGSLPLEQAHRAFERMDSPTRGNPARLDDARRDALRQAFAREPALGPFGIEGPRRHEFGFTVRVRD